MVEPEQDSHWQARSGDSLLDTSELIQEFSGKIGPPDITWRMREGDRRLKW